MYTPTVGPDGANQFITASQAARLLSVHLSTVRRWIKQGKLPAYRVGDKGIRVRYGDVVQLIAPLRQDQEEGGRMKEAGDFVPRRLTGEEQQQALAAVERARTLQVELRAKYGTMVPESWELLNHSRDERTRQLMRAVDE